LTKTILSFIVTEEKGGMFVDEEEMELLAERLKKGVEKKKNLKYLPNKISYDKAEQLIRMYLDRDLKQEKLEEIEVILKN